jgi:uncharacterized cupredoxin-like copper-binding protein
MPKYILTIGALAGLGGVVPADRLLAQPAPDTTITVRAGSALEFEPATIAVKAGIRVRLQLVNAGTLPHNFVIVRDSSDLDRLAAAASHQGGDYVPLALKDRMIGFTALASPGQTVDMVFVVPPPGEYTFVCLMSGHAGVMLGTLRSLR